MTTFLPPSTPLQAEQWPILLQRLDRLYMRLEPLNLTLTPQCWLAVNDLLLRLQQEQHLPETAQGFCDILAPLLCTTCTQQTQFTEVFYAWLRSTLLLAQHYNNAARDTSTPSDDPVPLTGAPLALKTRLYQGFYRHRYRWVALSLLLLSSLPFVYVLVEVMQEQVAKRVAVAAPMPAADEGATSPTPSPTLNQNPTDIVTATEQQDCVPTTFQQCWSAHRVWDFLQHPTFWLCFLSPVLGLWFTREFLQARQRLDRARLPRPKQPLHTIRLQHFPQLLFKSLVAQWPQKNALLVETRILDERKTIDKTLRHLERVELQAVYRQRREENDEVCYLVLVDRPHAADHAAVLADQLLAALQDLPIELRVYDFLADPRWCYPHTVSPQQTPVKSSAVSLDTLQQQYPDARLLLLGQGRGLFHELSGRLYPWTDVFQAWAIRICLVHQAQPWGAKQQALAQQGFLLTPFNTSGVTALVTWLQQQEQQGTVVPEEGCWFDGLKSQHFPELLRSEVWNRDRRPRSRQEKRRFWQLMQQLRVYLQADGGLLLAACAAYPEINGQLTLALEAHLFPEASSGEREQRLLKLSNLPWMQQGYMPQYLRAYLLDSVSPDDFQCIADILNRLLVWSATQKGALVLEHPILFDAKPATASWWQRRAMEFGSIWQVIKTKLSANTSEPTNTEHAIDLLLLKTLRGRSHSRLDFIPEALAQRWRQQTAWWSPLFKQSVIAGMLMLFVVVLYPLGMLWMMKATEPAASRIPIPRMMSIPAGSFDMGCLSNDEHCDEDEKPVHSVTIHAFKMSATEVTFAQYDYYCDQTDQEKPSDGGWGRGDRPVINVSLDDAQAYIQWLNKQTGQHYRLPTEAEWEYAARAGSTTQYSWGNEPSGEYANGNEERDWPRDGFTYTAPVGSYKPNLWGLYDMHGNVYEWVQDWYDESYYQSSSNSNPQGPAEGSTRVLRGGSWSSFAQFLRSAYRRWDLPVSRNNYIGFRLSLGQ